jgi:hypothetical protein
MIKRFVSLLLVMLLVGSTLLLSACGNAEDEVYEISFSEANSLEDMKNHDGNRVSIMGYMSTLSPVDGSFIYLMNMPYQSCPYCIPNTTTLSPPNIYLHILHLGTYSLKTG